MAKKRDKRFKKSKVIQRHHITYIPEKCVFITKGEHWVITQLTWHKRLSEGAKKAIRHILKTKPSYKIDGRKYKGKR